MKRFFLLPFAAVLSACSNTTMVAHKTAFDVNMEFTADLARPVSANIGYESHAAIAVPPRNSQLLGSLRDQKVLPKGDVLSTITSLKVEPVIVNPDPTKVVQVERIALDFVATAATGRAADVSSGNTAAAITGTSEKAGLKGTQTFQEAASDISNKPAAIPPPKRVADE